MTEKEVESIAKMASISDEILRIIANTRAWVKNYGVTLALTRNPKTPLALSMNLLARLNENDLRMLSTDRNVPEILRITARKKVVIDRRSGKLQQWRVEQVQPRSGARESRAAGVLQTYVCRAYVDAIYLRLLLTFSTSFPFPSSRLPLALHLAQALHVHRGLLALLLGRQALQQLDRVSEVVLDRSPRRLEVDPPDLGERRVRVGRSLFERLQRDEPENRLVHVTISGCAGAAAARCRGRVY